MSLRPSRRAQDIERTLIRKIFDSAPRDAINLGIGQPDLATPAVASLAGIEGIARGETRYTSTAGDPVLRAAVAERYPSLAGGGENVLITVGSQEAMFLSCMALVDPGDEILYPDPGYPAYPTVARLAGARGVSYPLRKERGFRVAADDIRERLSPATRLVILSSPSNPTGACNAVEDLRALLALLEQRGIPWLSDEIYSAFCYEGEFVSPAGISDGGGVVISSLSKDVSMTGWRVGWVVGPEEIVTRMTALHQYLVTCSPSVSQAAALGALSPEGQAERARYVEIFRRRRSLICEELARIPSIRFDPPEGAFYVFADVSNCGDCLEISRRILERRNVITIPGVAFGPGGEGYLRISFAASEDEIREGIRRIGEELSAG